MQANGSTRLAEPRFVDMDHKWASRLAEDKIVEVLYLASQYQFDFYARLEAMRDACEEVGWTIGSA